MVYTFDQPTAPTQKKVQYFENFGSRGVYFDGWYACTFGPRTPWLGAAARRASFPTALSASPDEGVSVGSHVVHARRKVFFAEFDL
jgi:arylsulfatase A-like enzyme